MKTFAIFALVGASSAFHLVTKDRTDDQYFNSLIGTMTVTAGNSPELSEDASKGIFADQFIHQASQDMAIQIASEKRQE